MNPDKGAGRFIDAKEILNFNEKISEPESSRSGTR